MVSGAAWQSVTPTVGAAGPVGNANLTTINVGITVQGTEAQLLAYVAGLSDLKRLFVTDNVTLTANGSKGAPAAPGAASATDQMQLQVTGRIFSQAGAAARRRCERLPVERTGADRNQNRLTPDSRPGKLTSARHLLP